MQEKVKVLLLAVAAVFAVTNAVTTVVTWSKSTSTCAADPLSTQDSESDAKAEFQHALFGRRHKEVLPLR